MPKPIAMPPSTSPNAHETSTQTSVRFGPWRSASQPQTKLIPMATNVSISRTMLAFASVRPIVFTTTTLMTTMTVLTASE